MFICAVRLAGATVVLLSAPPFDAASAKANVVPADSPEFGYKTPPRYYDSEVLGRYSQWLLGLRREGLLAVDSRSPMVEALERERRRNPLFTLAKDGVHPDLEGHWIIAAAVLEALGVRKPKPPRAHVLTLVYERWQVLGPAWLSRVGHWRNPAKLDVEAAQAQADELELRARLLVSK